MLSSKLSKCMSTANSRPLSQAKHSDSSIEKQVDEMFEKKSWCKIIDVNVVRITFPILISLILLALEISINIIAFVLSSFHYFSLLFRIPKG